VCTTWLKRTKKTFLLTLHGVHPGTSQIRPGCIVHSLRSFAGFFCGAERIVFVNANENVILNLASHQRFSLWCVGFPYEIRVRRSLKFDTVATILNSIQQPGRVFVTSFRPRPRYFIPNGFRLPLTSRVMAALEMYYFEPNMLQTPKMIAVKIVKWIIAWKEIHWFRWPCEGCKVGCRFSSFPPISSRTE